MGNIFQLRTPDGLSCGSHRPFKNFAKSSNSMKSFSITADTEAHAENSQNFCTTSLLFKNLNRIVIIIMFMNHGGKARLGSGEQQKRRPILGTCAAPLHPSWPCSYRKMASNANHLHSRLKKPVCKPCEPPPVCNPDVACPPWSQSSNK